MRRTLRVRSVLQAEESKETILNELYHLKDLNGYRKNILNTIIKQLNGLEFNYDII